MTGNDWERSVPELQARLKALARESMRAAPPSVEAALAAEFRRRHYRNRGRRGTWWYWAVGAAAACLLAVVGVVRFDRPSAAPHAVATVAPAPAARPAIQPDSVPVRKGLRTAARQTEKPMPATTPKARPEIATAFIPVSYGVGPGEPASMVRVRLPRSALLSFGLPMNAERASEPVIADVLLGEDGVARAIRFVR